MNKYIHLLSVAMLFMLSGCFPFSDDEDINVFIKSEDARAMQISNNYKAKPIEKVADYKAYTFSKTLKDPFKPKSFAFVSGEAVTSEHSCASQTECGKPPKAHIKGILEDYELSSFSLVGVLDDGSNDKVALVRTASLGVVPVKKGDYLGKNNGLVISIDGGLMIVSEKLFEAGQWKDMRKTLIIK